MDTKVLQSTRTVPLVRWAGRLVAGYWAKLKVALALFSPISAAPVDSKTHVDE